MCEEEYDVDEQHDMVCGWSFNEECGYCNRFLDELCKPENRDKLRKIVIGDMGRAK